MKNKFLTLFLATMLTLSLAACGNETNSNSYGEGSLQAETDAKASEGETGAVQSEAKDEKDAQLDTNLIEDALKNLNAASSMEAQMILEKEMVLEFGRVSSSVEGVTTWNMVCFYDTPKLKMDMTIDMGKEGIHKKSSYVETSEDGRITAYTYDEGQWQSEVISKADLKGYDAREIINTYISDIGDINNYKEEGIEEINGANAYKYSCIISREKLKAAIISSGSMETAASLGITESQLDDMIDDLGETVAYVWIDKETIYPVKFEVDWTEAQNALMVKGIEAMGEQAAGMSVRVPKDIKVITCFNYNNATDFTIPDEATQTN